MSNKNERRKSNIEKRRATLFAVSFLMTIGFPIGVLCVVFGATQNIIALLVIGIVLAAVGFYVMPVMWIQFGETKVYVSLYYAITRDHLRTVSDIAAQLAVTPEKALELIKKSISCRYIEGFKFTEDGTAIEEIIVKKRAESEFVPIKCSACGAVSLVSREDPRCPYCGSAGKIS